MSLVEKDAYSYNIQDTLPLRYVHWYWLNELFPRIQQFQVREWNNKDMYQHEQLRLIPLDYDKFDYFDNKYLEWWICKYSGVIYKE